MYKSPKLSEIGDFCYDWNHLSWEPKSPVLMPTVFSQLVEVPNFWGALVSDLRDCSKILRRSISVKTFRRQGRQWKAVKVSVQKMHLCMGKVGLKEYLFVFAVNQHGNTFPVSLGSSNHEDICYRKLSKIRKFAQMKFGVEGCECNYDHFYCAHRGEKRCLNNKVRG